tara:strand:+ start:1045 stop:1455 length:411 start_codon:yes stop_codon:yes gene_type:complete
MKKIDEEQYKIELYTTSLMLMLASADESISDNELNIIEKIIINFFKIDKTLSEKLINQSYNIIEEATDIYQIGSFINKSFSNNEKIKFLCCMFEIAYSDKEFHFMERHLINQITNILNISKENMIKAKKEISNNLL